MCVCVCACVHGTYLPAHLYILTMLSLLTFIVTFAHEYHKQCSEKTDAFLLKLCVVRLSLFVLCKANMEFAEHSSPPSDQFSFLPPNLRPSAMVSVAIRRLACT